MYHYSLHQQIQDACREFKLDISNKDQAFYTRYIANTSAIQSLYDELYGHHPAAELCWNELKATIIQGHLNRSTALQKRDEAKEKKGNWYLSNEITGMSLYVDRFCGNLKNLPAKLNYFTELGINFLHLMPIFQSPEGESDGGYAVSDFRKIDDRFGTLADLEALQQQMAENEMYLMLDIVLNHTVFFYANLGVDILRIDAPAFIWKQLGTTCQNLPQAHTILRLIKQCVQVAAPGVALLGEAIVAPHEIMKYFGTGLYQGRECDFAYNATQMALQWDALATGDIRVMLAAQYELLQKPLGSSWITYTRCHDDIGLGYDDSMIAAAGFNAYEHRKFLKDYYSGALPESPAKGALFSVNPKTQDARISGSLASLCGLETALKNNDEQAIELSIRKICLMQAQSFFIGGVPMLFYGDELGYTNDYSYLEDSAKSYDNRWMHRPIIDWQKNEKRKQLKSVEAKVYTSTQRLIQLRKKLPVVADIKNISWIKPHNIHIAGFIRASANQQLYCLFNFSNKAAYLTWYAFKEHGKTISNLYDHWGDKRYTVGADYEYLIIEPYSFCLLEVIE